MNKIKRFYYLKLHAFKIWLHRKSMPYPLMLYVTKNGDIEYGHVSLLYQQLYKKESKSE